MRDPMAIGDDRHAVADLDRFDEGVDGAVAGVRAQGRRALLAMLTVAAVIAAVAFWAGTLIHGSAGKLPGHVAEPAATVTVQREVLTESVAAEGEVALPGGWPIAPLAPELTAPGAQAIITSFRWRVGMAVRDGDLLAEVAGEPIFLLSGAVPAYRDLEFGDRGSDVAQLQAALHEAGYVVTDAAGYYGPSTAAAVAQLYESYGHVPPTAESPPLDRSKGEASPGGRHPQGTGRPAEAPARRPMLPVWSVVYVKHLPATVSAVQAKGGQRMTSERPVMEVTDRGPVVHLDLMREAATRLTTGMNVRMLIGGQRVVGHIDAIGTSWGKHQGGPGQSSGPTSNEDEHLVVGIGTAPGPDVKVGAHVEATVTIASSHRDVLVVPLSAVGNEPPNRLYVEVMRKHRTMRVNVDEGLTANGEVAISPVAGSYINQGEQVVVRN